MNKTAIKIFILFSVTAGVIATILMIINFLGFAIVGSDISPMSGGQTELLNSIAEQLESGNREVELPDGYWCMLIDENGNVVWEQDKPTEVPNTYTINDIARMTRWFLNDYPVYTRTEDYGLIVMGKPKNAVGKYEMEYSMSWFDSLPQRIIYVLLINLFLAAVIACIFGINFYHRICELTRSISNLRSEKPVKLKERGIFKDTYRNINITSSAIERKNEALSIRENARQNWIAGISHDIRTPLSVITGYAQTLAENTELSENDRQRASVIVSNSMKIKKLIEDLNLISSMEYDMQPSKKQRIRICPLIRRVTAEILNNGLPDTFSIELNLKSENAVIMGDENLLERAVFNIMNNAVTHNKNGCKIIINEFEKNGFIVVEIRDNGSGIPDSVIENIKTIPKTTHGIGLPMAYRIVSVHGGVFEAHNDNGFCVAMSFPID